MDEEKTIDEAVEEQADEMKEFEPVAFDEVIKDEPAKDTAPVLQALGDPEPADMNMIHKHVDNFLAKIAGETPIDENVRDSTEYWLNRIAEAGGGGGGGASLYKHNVKLSSLQNVEPYVLAIIYTNSETAFTSIADVAKWLFDNNYNDSKWVYPVYARPTGDVNIYFGIYSFNSTTLFITLTKLDLSAGTHDEQNKQIGYFISDTVVQVT